MSGRTLRGCSAAWERLSAICSSAGSASQVPCFAVVLIPLATLSMVAWHGLLRPGEIYRLTAGCAMLVSSDVMVLLLFHPKTSRSDARQQFATVRSPVAVSWMRWLLPGLPSATRLWPSDSTLSAFRP